MSEYLSAAVCKRGHVESPALELARGNLAKRCQQCGARILSSCPSCNAHIRGQVLGLIGPYDPPEFCAECGSPYPWSSRQSIVYHIENTLDEESELTEGDRRVLQEQLAALRESPTTQSVEKRQISALESLRDLAPKAWATAKPLVVSIATAEIKQKLGLPPG